MIQLDTIAIHTHPWWVRLPASAQIWALPLNFWLFRRFSCRHSSFSNNKSAKWCQHPLHLIMKSRSTSNNLVNRKMKCLALPVFSLVGVHIWSSVGSWYFYKYKYTQKYVFPLDIAKHIHKFVFESCPQSLAVANYFSTNHLSLSLSFSLAAFSFVCQSHHEENLNEPTKACRSRWDHVKSRYTYILDLSSRKLKPH